MGNLQHTRAGIQSMRSQIQKTPGAAAKIKYRSRLHGRQPSREQRTLLRVQEPAISIPKPVGIILLSQLVVIGGNMGVHREILFQIHLPRANHPTIIVNFYQV